MTIDSVNKNVEQTSVRAVFERICESRGISLEELGKRFNKTLASMSQHQMRDTFDFRLLIEAFPDADLNWLFRGAEAPARRAEPTLPQALEIVRAAGFVPMDREALGLLGGITPET